MMPDGALPTLQQRTASTVHLFGRARLRAPAVDVVPPSGPAQARFNRIAPPDDSSPVLEPGPGTGVLTRALSERGIAPFRIAAIGASARFATVLGRRLSGVSIRAGDAARLRHLAPFAPAEVGPVICGPPLLSMPRAKVLRIVSGSFGALRPVGRFRPFTHGPPCPVPRRILDRRGLTARRPASVPLNIPSASVYVLRHSGGNV